MAAVAGIDDHGAEKAGLRRRDGEKQGENGENEAKQPCHGRKMVKKSKQSGFLGMLNFQVKGKFPVAGGFRAH
jgi:hypothetical protein